MTRVSGLLLAAGAGRRMGRPKALLRDAADRPRLLGAVDVLLEGGCDEVVVVLGAEAEQAETLLTEGTSRWPADTVCSVRADDWDRGMAASLAAGLAATGQDPPDALVVLLVDLPDVGAAVVTRVADAWREAGAGHGAVARAAYDGEPGHPVLLGLDHQLALAAEVARALGTPGAVDFGARHYLATLASHDRREVALVECGDLATGHDVDRPEDLL
ncbi:NTP transferase domain-containing protein [Nocardioides sp. HDW12B]|uniref:nucleotidyltransferase family protein n=1 Tax=Nocardioides sp. HDW12B TaxID=2714939 RepID=UPI00140CFE17|nr:NTP transferase domain-containing protein [Nocardioides sp. HDW12B]QIK65204.1 NTP transferase domain-containing protein [Nocardioides sp. HDW12B]